MVCGGDVSVSMSASLWSQHPALSHDSGTYEIKAPKCLYSK